MRYVFVSTQFIQHFPEELRVQQLIAKWILSDYFAIRMLLKRIKGQTSKELEPIIKFFMSLEMHERELNFAELLKVVTAGKELFLQLIPLYVQARASTEQHILRTIGRYFTCYELSKLADIFGRTPEQTRELVMVGGFSEEGGWVKFPLSRLTNSVEKEKALLKDKQYELTQLSTLLSAAK